MKELKPLSHYLSGSSTLHDDLKELLEYHMKKRCLSAVALCEEIGINRNMFARHLRQESHIQQKTVIKIYNWIEKQ